MARSNSARSHLILHKHGGPRQGRSAELEAHAFAGHFLMPRDDILATIPFITGVAQLVKAKKRWGVSVPALAYHLHRLGLVSDWHHRTLCIQINKQFGRSEPDSLSPERSGVWQMVLRELWKDKMARNHIARDLAIPEDELENLIFGLTGEIGPPENPEKPHLQSV
jgi:Zn-dependent peptidase ImmA (M78 family)